MEDIILWFVGIVTVIVVVGILSICIFSIKIPLGNNGSHSGYVTAVEREGIFFKKYRVYFKTDTSSSQEDQYCIEDKNNALALKLEKEAEAKNRITVHYSESFVT